ncbi:J domain-containing protein [Marinomonas mediterranea]|jgi:DnaJ-class molecular chaperone with C-terminal Zn finger domain|uniref:Heat shock protein DnaJ domain protein n=1 Tax=Marinomonas mediterranea (strain ATCC 700492 / JCM 21426 / NBRC 103028 / MMB-1) TaxID=717774 RepID=F2JU32_MARM1|nr:J domain-containing protein [Marinomonas mediterranea]ADZ91544.1 heat shock protein DnaJ domain protein [Marinomonas mediterranea MMB-1]WCN17649.1 DnaJ domain-containing protein [Marinomonas mediterranea MMB-1]
MSLIDDYHILQIPATATEQDVKAAFRRLARQYHPDKNPDNDTTELFQRLQSAYQNVLDAIKSGTQPQDWQPYHFASEAKPSSFTKSGFSFKNDTAQEELVRERQRAYEEMKRNNAKKDQARDEAIRAARNTLNERRVKALYEEAFKQKKSFDYGSKSSSPYSDADSQQENLFKHSDINPNNDTTTNTQYQFDSETFQNPFSSFDTDNTSSKQPKPTTSPIRLKSAKLAFRATTYIACFAAGIYTTLYWQEVNVPNPNTAEDEIGYIAGLYPNLRLGDAYTLDVTPMYSEPNSSNPPLMDIPSNLNVTVQQAKGNWLALKFSNHTGWASASKFGFGTFENAEIYGCHGHPGIAPDHGELVERTNGSHKKPAGKSRLRVLNQLPHASMLRFESLEGAPPFAIYLHAKQALAANYIPRGKYKLVLETGSLYHRACQHFVFNDQEHTLMDSVDFTSTERSITLRP